MQRVELLTALEQQLGGEVPEAQLAEIYSVRDLVDAVLASAAAARAKPEPAAPAWSTILSEPVTDPEVLALARHNVFAEVSFFLLGRLIYLFALDGFHLKCADWKICPKRPLPALFESPSYVDPLVMAGALPYRLFRDTFALGASDIFGKGFMRRLARWLRVVVLDPDANLVPAMRAGLPASVGTHARSLSRGRTHQRRQPRVFRKGAAILSIHAPAPIVPIAIEGFYEAGHGTKNLRASAICNWCSANRFNLRPLEEASEAAYERLTSELKARVVAMWQELRKKELRKKELREKALQENELRGKDLREPQSNSKPSALAETL